MHWHQRIVAKCRSARYLHMDEDKNVKLCSQKFENFPDPAQIPAQIYPKNSVTSRTPCVMSNPVRIPSFCAATAFSPSKKDAAIGLPDVSGCARQDSVLFFSFCSEIAQNRSFWDIPHLSFQLVSQDSAQELFNRYICPYQCFTDWVSVVLSTDSIC